GSGGGPSGGQPTIIEAITIGMIANAIVRNRERPDIVCDADIACPPGCKELVDREIQCTACVRTVRRLGLRPAHLTPGTPHAKRSSRPGAVFGRFFFARRLRIARGAISMFFRTRRM